MTFDYVRREWVGQCMISDPVACRGKARTEITDFPDGCVQVCRGCAALWYTASEDRQTEIVEAVYESWDPDERP